MKSIGKIAYLVPSESEKETVSAILKDEIREGILDVMMIDVNDPESEYKRICGPQAEMTASASPL